MPIRKNASMEKYIKDFEKSDAPQFKNKSKDKRIQMAVAAKLQSMGKKMKEGSELTEKKGTLCGRCGHVHVKGTSCPRPFKEGELTERIDFDEALNLRAIKVEIEDEIIQLRTEMEDEGDESKANYYGQQLNKLEDRLSKVKKQLDDYDMNEGAAKTTAKYDDAPELKGGQKRLPDMLQKAIVDKVMGKLKEAEVSPAEKTAKDAEIKALQARKKAIDDELSRIQRTGLTEGMERDYEGKMAKAQLISIVKNAKDLFDSVDDNTQLKAWIQSKLTKAEDYISSVRTYLDGESLTTTTPLIHNSEPVRDDEGAALNIGDVVKAADGKIYQVIFSYSEGKPFLTPFDLKRRKPMNLRERHYFDNVSEEMNKTLKMSKVMEYTATKGGFMR